MRRRVATLAAVSALALALSASPASAGSPAVHVSVPAAGIGFWCGTDAPPAPPTYTVPLTSTGTFSFVTRTATSPSGNWILTGTLTPRNVVVEDAAGNEYSVVGVEHFSETLNARTGPVAVIDGDPVSQATFTGKFQIVGTADSFNLVQHGSPNGTFNEFVLGTCTDLRG
jgi:hypothetical protein